ncbi:MAG: hypothetical protein HOQ18_11310 [Dermatophilaceae bacterium]|nr:hypothetical protein [Dermatophilaceae bacterium]
MATRSVQPIHHFRAPTGTVARPAPVPSTATGAASSPSAVASPVPSFAVPWVTVVTLAVGLSFADGFWVISVRGAVGAIERTSQPFATWLRESAVMTPLYVVAVLAALTVAARRFGPVLRGGRAVVASAWLVALAASLVGAAHLLVSAVVDFRLQSGLIDHMGAMSTTCGADCVARLESDSFWLQARATGYGAAILLLTNVLVVGWMVAMRGGRLRVTSTREAHASRVDDRVLGLVGALLGAAVIHVAVVPEHLTEWAAAGLFFIVLAAAQLLLGLAVLVRPTRIVRIASVVVAAGPIVLWFVSRTVGLPLGPEPGVPEALGMSDLVCAVLEAAAVAFALSLGPTEGVENEDADEPVRVRATSAHRTGLVVVAMLAVTLVGVSANGMVLLGGDVHGSSISQSEGAAGQR